MKSLCLAAVLLPLVAFSQNAPTGAPANNGMKNGRFEQFAPKNDLNLWTGVDAAGCLAGFVQSVSVVTEAGHIGSIPIPPSVQVADLNGDGLPDIFMVDGYGYFRVFFNSGTKTEPKFTTSEIAPLFFRRVVAQAYWQKEFWERDENAFHACLADFAKRGTMDILMGNYLGRLLLVKNSGSATVPEWRQPAKYTDAWIPTTKDNHCWGNLLAPVVWDWNGDGKLDVAVGEGSYSANSIHLLLNKGSSSALKFDEDGREYLAFGEGREQLVPAVVDWNGDGQPDLLVGDRMGTLTLYLAKAPWQQGKQLERQPEPVRFGGTTTIGLGPEGAKCICPAVGDLNGDGLFDIIVARTNGRIAVAYNTGTKTEPKFGPLVEIKGENIAAKEKFAQPAGWEIVFGLREGNAYGYYACVSPTEDPEAAGATGARALKFAYTPSQNKIIRRQSMIYPTMSGKNEMAGCWAPFSGDGKSTLAWGLLDDISYGLCESNVALFRQQIDSGFLKPGGRYKLSFNVKGHGVKNCRIRFTAGGWLVRDTKKGGVEPGNWVSEVVNQDEEFPVSPKWTPVTKTINVRFEKVPELNSPERFKNGGRTDYKGALQIYSSLDPDVGALYFDDVQLTPM